MKELFSVLNKGILAGIFIGIAGMGFLANKTVGMFLFAFGLCAVISYEAKLFTGVSGFVKNKQDLLNLLPIIFGNIVGCCLVSIMAQCGSIDIINNAIDILEKRMNNGPILNFTLSIGCGILMTTAVTFAKQGDTIRHWLPLLLGVPLFILCGFPHCIADAFYYLTCPNELLWQYKWVILMNYVCIVLGNFIGCNVSRIFLKKN